MVSQRRSLSPVPKVSYVWDYPFIYYDLHVDVKVTSMTLFEIEV